MTHPSLPDKLSGALTIAQKKVSQVCYSFNCIAFESCYEGSRDGHNLPATPGLYAFKHRDGRVLYVGKSTNIRKRFKARHEVFVDLFFAGYAAPDVRIAVVSISGNYLPLLEVMEALVIFTLRPEFNRKVYSLAEMAAMVAVRSFTIPADVELTDLLDTQVVSAIRDYGVANGLTPNQVIELALAQFLDFEAVTLDGYEHLQTYADLKNEIAMLQAELRGLKQNGEM
ncbi:hypothetical protein [Leptolyngbya sp. FACHB-17]|uniref:hypothetical protein n=1 Tax=unclassified Leptolyngbya TaxID=2650499 RepID=UPI0016803DDC|nr:hypothetical protein [Leptolyngbya sp. FACHB-17]MBD2082541.1 hypothetical protein [Leptolyngbya sp. FACHB-17]